LEQAYYNHLDIPFFVVVIELWIGECIEKKIFVTISKHNKQDSNYVLDSVNYILSFQILENVDTIYLISDNANNLKNGKDLFNIFSQNGPLSGTDKKKKFKILRIFSWFFLSFKILIMERGFVTHLEENTEMSYLM
jgi:hypothetical protein